MELARLASKQAASNQATKQASSLSRPQSSRGSQNPKKNVAMLSGMVFCHFLGETLSFWSVPHVVQNVDLLGFWPVLGGGQLEKFRDRAETRKPQFPGARGTFAKKNRPSQNFLPKIVQLFYTLRFGHTGFLVAPCTTSAYDNTCSNVVV